MKIPTKKLISYSQKDIENNSNVYGAFIKLGVYDGWEKSDKKENFELLLKFTELTNIPLKGAAILDVGCGTGDFIPYLRRQYVGKYLGIDIFEDNLIIAMQKYPDETFQLGDFLQLKLDLFDFIFCSGALTTHLDSDNYLILESWVNKMWNLAKAGVGFNLLLQNHPTDNNHNPLFYYERQRVLEIISRIKKAKISIVYTDAGMDNEIQEMHVFLYK